MWQKMDGYPRETREKESNRCEVDGWKAVTVMIRGKKRSGNQHSLNKK